MARACVAGTLATGLVAAPAQAQVAGGLRITPSLDTSVTLTDSSLLNSGSDVVTQIRPGVFLTSYSGRVRGSLNYGLDAVHHSRQATGDGQGNGQANSLQNNLAAQVNAELLEHSVFMDATANVSQQSISAYGQQSVDGTQLNSNRTEVTRVSLSPYTSGSLAGLVTYRLAVNADGTHWKNGPTPYSLNTGTTLSLASAAANAKFGWSASLSQNRSRFSGSQPYDSGRYSLSLLFRPDPEVTGSLRAGQETSSVTNAYRQTYNNWGGDLRWVPSVRTTASVSLDHRYFGRSQQITLDQRFANSTVRYTSSRDVSDNSNPNGVGQPVTLYDLFYKQFASVQPDPALRDQLVRDFLRALGQNPNSLVSGGFNTGGVTLQRRDDLSMSYAGLRTTFTLQAYTSSSSRIDAANTNVDTGPVRQLGVTTGLSYRLTPTASLNLIGSRLRTLATDTQAGNQLSSLTFSGSEQLGRRTSLSLSGRYSRFSGPTNPYRETSLSATLGLRF